MKKFDKTKCCKAILTEDGKEINNPTPLFVSTGTKRLSLKEQIARLVSVELSQRAECIEQETYEEANDFDIDEDYIEDKNTPYTLMVEEVPIPPPSPLPTDGEAVIAAGDTESPKGDKRELEEGAPKDAG